MLQKIRLVAIVGVAALLLQGCGADSPAQNRSGFSNKYPPGEAQPQPLKWDAGQWDGAGWT
jgi:hypothetical protein